MLTIREETIGDTLAIDHVNEQAFNRRDEAELVVRLREGEKVIFSLVALQDDEIIGHILFSPMHIVAENGTKHRAVGLGPVAVLPAFQGQGVGSSLMEAGLEKCRAVGYDIVLVLGHSSYYPRFGFRPAVDNGITCAYEVPDDAFMALELIEGALNQVTGVAYYQPEFDAV